MRKSSRWVALAIGLAVVLLTVSVLTASAQGPNPNPRWGKWKLKSDAPPPAINIMTYEPYGDDKTGMKITVESTNAEGVKRKWSYVTMFDGKYRPVEGDTGTEETAVEIVDEHTNKIMNKTGERVNIIINVLSEDGNTINNEYQNVQEDGSIRTSHAVYERIQ